MPNAAVGDSATRGGKAGGGKGGAVGNGGKGSGNRPRQGDWACFLCGFQSNREFRGRCWSCDALRSASMEQAFGAYAQRQLQQQKQAQGQQQRQPKRNGGGGSAGASSATAECKELREKIDKLQAELATTKALAARGNATVEEDEDMQMADEGESDYAAWTEEERAKRLELARGGLAYAAACYGEESAQANELRDTIASLQKASREAKPFKAHRNLLERRREELRRRQERDEAAISATQAEMAELQSKLDALKAAVEERAKAISSVTEELNELVLKTLAEEGGGGGDDKKTAGAQAGSPWAAVASALQPLAGQPGMPPEVTALLAQVQQIAESCAKAAAASAPQRAAAQPPAEGPTAPVAGVAADGQPGVLAPQWRRGKAAIKPTPSPHHLQHPDPTAAAASLSTPLAAAATGEVTRQGGGGASSGGTTTTGGPCPTTPPADGGAAAAAAAGAAAAAATTVGAGATTASGGASDDELVEAADGCAMQVDIEESISKLPDRDQRRLRAALRMGGGGGRPASSDGGDASAEADTRRQERERSPRPTKTGDKDI